MSKIVLTEEAGVPSTPAAGKWTLYTKAGGLYYLDDAGTEIGPLNVGTTLTKAAASDVTTGTDDAKYVTAKSIKDSVNVPNVAPSTSGNVLTSNGTAWTSAIPPIREKLSAARTYYVATAAGGGNDANAGLTAGTPFLTIQKAYNVAVTIDLNGNNVTIKLADGTYTAGLTASTPLVGGNLVINGNSATPANVIVQDSGYAINIQTVLDVTVSNFTINTTQYCLVAYGNGASIHSSTGMIYGATTYAHIWAYGGGTIWINQNYTINGGSVSHFNAQDGGKIISPATAKTVTNSGTNAFTAFANARNGIMDVPGMTFTGGTITGARYALLGASAIDTQGGGANYFPGNSAGTGGTTTGNGFYI